MTKIILITDTNIIFSALVKPSGEVASILKNEPKFKYVAPKYLKEEIKLHWDKLQKLDNINKC